MLFDRNWNIVSRNSFQDFGHTTKYFRPTGEFVTMYKREQPRKAWWRMKTEIWISQLIRQIRMILTLKVMHTLVPFQALASELSVKTLNVSLMQ